MASLLSLPPETLSHACSYLRPCDLECLARTFNSKLTPLCIHERDMAQTRARERERERADVVTRRVQVLADANQRRVTHVKFDLSFLQAISDVLDQRQKDTNQMEARFDGAKRTSHQYTDGLTVAQSEYDAELKARRDAESEVTRLRVLLSGQAARLSVMSGVTAKQELQQRFSQQMTDDLSGLERQMSKLRVERDMTLAEVEELSASKSTGALSESSSSRSLRCRLDMAGKALSVE